MDWKKLFLRSVRPSTILLEESKLSEYLKRCKCAFGWTVKSDKDKLVPTRLQTGWRKSIDYWNLNAVTEENHFPLPFIDKILERIDVHEFYRFLDGYSGYYHIDIAPDRVFVRLAEDVKLSASRRQKYDMTSVDLFEREKGQTIDGKDVTGAHMIYEGKN